MYTDRLELAETYRGYSDTEIASMYEQRDNLTLEARDVLAIEIERRGLKSAHLTELYAAEQRREANLDRLENTRRKKLAVYLLLGRNPKLTLVLLAASFLVGAIAIVFSRH